MGERKDAASLYLQVGRGHASARPQPEVLTVECATQIRERIIRRLSHDDLQGAKNNSVLQDWTLFHAGPFPSCLFLLAAPPPPALAPSEGGCLQAAERLLQMCEHARQRHLERWAGRLVASMILLSNAFNGALFSRRPQKLITLIPQGSDTTLKPGGKPCKNTKLPQEAKKMLALLTKVWCWARLGRGKGERRRWGRRQTWRAR